MNMMMMPHRKTLRKMPKFHLIPGVEFSANTQFLQSFRQIAKSSAETARFHKISTPRNKVKLRCFMLEKLFRMTMF